MTVHPTLLRVSEWAMEIVSAKEKSFSLEVKGQPHPSKCAHQISEAVVAPESSMISGATNRKERKTTQNGE